MQEKLDRYLSAMGLSEEEIDALITAIERVGLETVHSRGQAADLCFFQLGRGVPVANVVKALDGVKGLGSFAALWAASSL